MKECWSEFIILLISRLNLTRKGNDTSMFKYKSYHEKHGKMEVQLHEILTSRTKYPNWAVLTTFWINSLPNSFAI